MSYRVHLCGDGSCPNDGEFEHRFYFGCVPKTFSDRTGRARGHSQTPTVIDGLPWQVYLWDGGCDAAGVTAQQKLADYARSARSGTRRIVLDIGRTKDGHPRHPLYVRGDAPLVPYEVQG